MNIKTKILTFVGYYLPGYKAGGPLRTIANMVDHLSDEFDFMIVTRDRDLGDTSPYVDIKVNQWQQVSGVTVYYLPPEKCTLRGIANLVANTSYDVLYLNSFFEPVFTIKPLLARRLGCFTGKPVIVAPRGEFSTGAIKLKSLKKLVYIHAARLFNLYKDVIWQASSEHEAQDIVRVMKESPAAIHVALDLPGIVISGVPVAVSAQSKVDGFTTRIVFLSRISPMKNLAYALQVLGEVKTPVMFDIYGPIEDVDYWQRCTELMQQLPANVSVRYLGSIQHEQVMNIFSGYDLFFFPTLGENYGHVIAEALSVGTPVLISDKTPWLDLQAERLGWDRSLDDMSQFVSIIDAYSVMTATEKSKWRDHISRRTAELLTSPLVFEANRSLFRRAMQKISTRRSG